MFNHEASTLSFEDLKNKFYTLDNWFNSPQGAHLGHAFVAELTHLNDFLYGTTLLQLGSCGDNLWLQTLHYSHKWLATPYLSLSKSTLLTSFTQLPLDRGSVDCVIAPLVLEAFTHQKNPLDEIDRILKPMGYVVFLGINPMSLWGASMRLGRLPCFGAIASKAMSVFFVKRAMLHRGYIQCSLSNLYYIPPLKQEKWLHKLEILNELGKMIWPCPAGFYCLVVQKQQETHPDVLLETTDKKKLLFRDRIPLQPVC